MMMTRAETVKIEKARELLRQATAMLEQSQWLEERREDTIRTLKYVEFYLGFHFPGGPEHGC